MPSPAAEASSSSATEAVRKRPRETMTPPSSSSSGGAFASDPSPATTIASEIGVGNPADGLILQAEVDVLRAELEREKSLRTLERRKATASEGRLRRQLEFLSEEAEESKSLLDEMRARTDADLERMSAARRDALSKLRDCERRLRAVTAGEVDGVTTGGGGKEDPAVEIERRRAARTKEKVDALVEENGRLRAAVSEAEERAAASERRAREAEALADGDDDEEEEEEGEKAAEGAIFGDENDASAASSFASPRRRAGGRRKGRKSPSSPPLSPAPPAVMTELNKTRVKLAEAERSNRQLRRRVEDLSKRARESIAHREAAAVARAKAEAIEAEMKSLREERESIEAAGRRWAEFRAEVDRALEGEDGAAAASDDDGDEPIHPPEVAAVLRHFRTLRRKCRRLEVERSDARSELESTRRRVAALERSAEEESASSSRWREERKELEGRARASTMEVRKVKAQEKVWRREADSLRALLKTYEDDALRDPRQVGGGETKKRKISLGTPSKPGTATAATTTTTEEEGEDVDGPTAKGLQVSLDSAREQIRILTDSETAAKNEAETTKAEHERLKAEHERVTEKFGKLRDALYKEREKAEKAEDRAAAAETLAGKGSYWTETTKVLHLRSNPFTEALREKHKEEIDKLKGIIERMEAESSSAAEGNEGGAAGGGGGSKTPAASSRKHSTPPGSGLSSLDAQKLHQRLKESFKEQIGLFREGVYLLTGYKVDMYSDSDRPRFKVRSVYSERQDDHLLFVWPKVPPGEDKSSVTSLDLLDTEMAQVLSKTDSFAYVTKFKSVPAFMASVTLSLFEKQTFVGG